MTEAQWMACTDPTPMLRFLNDRISARKLQLFSCACVRQLWRLMPQEVGRRAVEVAELAADGLASESDRQRAAAEAWTPGGGPDGPCAIAAQLVTNWPAYNPFDGRCINLEWWDDIYRPTAKAEGIAFLCATEESVPALMSEESTTPGDGFWRRVLRLIAPALGRKPPQPTVDPRADARSWQVHLLRCICGNPFWPISFDPAWRTPSALGLAQAIYECGHFSDLPILADALEEAGCDNADLLAHCHEPGPHARGCWVVDLLLGKE